MKNKKAISPLIATVLIIGFTIVLAAVVIQWGGQLVERLKGQTDINIERTDLCQKFTDLSISRLLVTAGLPDSTATVQIDNKNDQAMEGFVLRAYLDDGTVKPETKNTPIGPFGVSGDSSVNFAGTLDEVGVVPQVKLSDGSVVACGDQEAKKAYVAP